MYLQGCTILVRPSHSVISYLPINVWAEPWANFIRPQSSPSSNKINITFSDTAFWALAFSAKVDTFTYCCICRVIFFSHQKKKIVYMSPSSVVFQNIIDELHVVLFLFLWFEQLLSEPIVIVKFKVLVCDHTWRLLTKLAQTVHSCILPGCIVYRMHVSRLHGLATVFVDQWLIII